LVLLPTTAGPAPQRSRAMRPNGPFVAWWARESWDSEATTTRPVGRCSCCSIRRCRTRKEKW